ncbi:D-alanyl-D-alanine carboxypeptidase family protein [Dolosicoccus paucivorans]
MRNIKKWMILWSSCLILISSFLFPSTSLAANRPEVTSEGALLTDANTGQILYKKKENDLYDIGELTKILSTYLIYQLIEEGTLSLEDKVSISDEVYSLSQNYSIPNVPLRQDKEYTVNSLLHAIGVGQANSAMLALVEHVDGTEDKFVERMKRQLEQWGIKEYELYNATGMDQEKRNKLTPTAVGLCAYQLLNIAPDFVEETKKEIDLFDAESEDTFEMLNPLNYSDDSVYEGLDGLMGGVNDQDHFLSVQTAKKDSLRLISVILNPTSSTESHNDHKRLLTYGFAAFRLDHVLNQGDKIKNIARIAVRNGKEAFAELKYQDDVAVVTPLIDTAPVFNYHFVPDPSYFEGDQLMAPIKEHTAIGRLEVQVEGSAGEYLPSLNPPNTAVIVAEPIEKGNGLIRFFRKISTPIDQWGANIRKFFIRIFN